MSKQRGLGKGLGALIVEKGTSEYDIKEISLNSIQPNPHQPRKDFDLAKLQELANSIQEHGLIQPILVKQVNDNYIIVAGERRFRACKIADIEKIKAIVIDCDQQEMTEKALIENIQRTDLSPIEEGMAYARLIEEYQLTQEQVAKRVGKARTTITNLLRIIQLPIEVIEYINSGKLSLGHAKVLLALEDQTQQKAFADEIVSEDLSVRQTEQMIHQAKENITNPSSPHKKEKKRNGEFEILEEEIRNTLQTKVLLKGNENRGKIEIQYYSKEELDRLLDLWQIKVN